jgi:hypothetical protein
MFQPSGRAECGIQMGKIAFQPPSKAKVSIKKAAEFSGCGLLKIVSG